jgi:UDP-N-acetylmuramate dehydrogenase
MEVGNRIAWVEGYDLETLEWKKFTHEECKFGYRTSIFKSALQNRFLVTHVVFALEKFSTGYAFNTNYADVQSILKGKQPIHLQEISEIIATIRAKKLPDLNVIGTAGSFFANPFVCMQHFEALQKEYPEMPWYPTPSPFGDSP